MNLSEIDSPKGPIKCAYHVTPISNHRYVPLVKVNESSVRVAGNVTIRNWQSRCFTSSVKTIPLCYQQLLKKASHSDIASYNSSRQPVRVVESLARETNPFPIRYAGKGPGYEAIW